MKERLLLVGFDKKQEEILSDRLGKKGCLAVPANNFEEARSLLSKEKFTICLMDIDSSETAVGDFRQLSHNFKDYSRLPKPPVFIVFTYKKDFRKIAAAIEAGADKFIFKPFETDCFLERLKGLLNEIKLERKIEKKLDLNNINYLINLITEEGDREGFFLLSTVIFNVLIIDKIKTVLGEQVIEIMFKRICELTGDVYGFMRQARLQDGKLFMDEVEKASCGISLETLGMGFRNFIYDFLHLIQTLTSNIIVEKWAEECNVGEPESRGK